MLKLKFTKASILANSTALFAGVLLVFAFAPVNFYPLAVTSPAILLYLWLQCDYKQAFWRGFYFGLGFFGVGTSWIFVSINTYGNTVLPIALFITALFVLLFTLFPAVNGYWLNRFFPNSTATKIYLAFPCTWVLLEWFRSIFLTGFPWLFLGASQTSSPLHGLTPIIGEYGISFAVLLTSASLVNILRQPKNQVYKSLLFILLIWGTAYGLTYATWTQASGNPVKVSLVQGDIPQQMKWNAAYIKNTLQKYYDLTQPHWDSNIIVWPEAAVPLLLQNAQGYINLIDSQAKQHHTALILGIPIQQGFSYYNALMVLGNGHGIYYKRHLVPFGEYVPLESMLRGLIGIFDLPMSAFSAGDEHQQTLQAAGINFAAFICYEVAYANLVSKDLPQAQLLINISDDAWFAHSLALAQQLQMAQVRAQETGRYALIGTNDGLTAIISPQGQILNEAPPYIPTVLTGTVTAMNGCTPFIYLGVNSIVGFFAILFILGWVFECRYSKHFYQSRQQNKSRYCDTAKTNS